MTAERIIKLTDRQAKYFADLYDSGSERYHKAISLGVRLEDNKLHVPAEPEARKALLIAIRPDLAGHSISTVMALKRKVVTLDNKEDK